MSPAEPDFDAAPLADIAAAIPPAEFRAFLEEYLTNAADRARRVRALLQDANLPELKLEAHKLISTLGSFGLKRAAVLARELETACRDGKMDDVRRLVGEITASSERGWAALRQKFLGTPA